MNMHAKIGEASAHRSRRAGRRRFTADELLAMEQKGILHPEEKVELIDGEIITMAAKSPRRDDMCAAIVKAWARRLPGDVDFTMEPAFRLSEFWEPEPDIIVFPGQLRPSQLRGDTVLLVVEVAVTSLSHDLEIKAPMYAAHGVRDYWVVDAMRLVIHVHRDPTADGYKSVAQFPAGQRVSPHLLPDLSIDLADLGMPPLSDTEDRGDTGTE